MRWWNFCARSSAFVVVCLGCGAGTSSSDGGAGCAVALAGNLAEEARGSACASLTDSGSGTALSIATGTSMVSRITASIDLGAAPAPGRVTSEGAGPWNVLAFVTAANCTFQAGDGSVPNGSFVLTLDTVDPAMKVAHGHLEIVTYVHAAPGTDCGDGDVERITVDF